MFVDMFVCLCACLSVWFVVCLIASRSVCSLVCLYVSVSDVCSIAAFWCRTTFECLPHNASQPTSLESGHAEGEGEGDWEGEGEAQTRYLGASQKACSCPEDHDGVGGIRRSTLLRQRGQTRYLGLPTGGSLGDQIRPQKGTCSGQAHPEWDVELLCWWPKCEGLPEEPGGEG